MAAAFTDLHGHLIPGVDDGAPDTDAARAALRALAAEGVVRAVATPHVDASVLADPQDAARRLTELDMGWALLERVRAELEEGGAREDEGREGGAREGGAPDPAGVPELARGAEVRLDAPDVDFADPRVRLAGGEAVLVEFAFFEVPVYAGRQLRAVRDAGWTPVLAHAERYRGLGRALSRVEGWRKEGTVVQVNAGSLAGRYGRKARARARLLLGRGLADVVASDFHARGQPGLREAHGLLAEDEDDEAARLLLVTNPRRVLEGKPLFPVPPLETGGRLGRWLGR